LITGLKNRITIAGRTSEFAPTTLEPTGGHFRGVARFFRHLTFIEGAIER
jgi:hypothetical protein